MAEKQLLDQYGNVIKLDKGLMKEVIATPTLKGVRAVKTNSVATGLNPVKCARLIKAANEGDIFDYLTMAEEAEELSGHYYSVLSTRKLAIRGVEPIVSAASEDKKDIEIAEEVKAIVEGAEFTDLVAGLIDAISKGFSVCEVIYNTAPNKWTPTSYNWIDPRNFTFDKESRTIPLLLQDGGDPSSLAYGKFVYHTPKLKSGITIRGGLARVVLWPLMFASFSERDWMAFTEVFGMPIRVGKYSGKPTEEEINVLWQAVAGIASNSAAVIPESMTIDFVTSSNSANGDKIFASAADHFNATISKIVLGQTMTTEDGSSNAQAQVHNDVRLDILEADCKALASTIQRDLIAPYIVWNYGTNVKAPKISFPVPKPEDMVAFVEAVTKLVPLGLEVSEQDVREKLGISEPAKGAKLLSIAGVDIPPGSDGEKINKTALNALMNSKKTLSADDLLDELEDDYFDDFVAVSGGLADTVLDELDVAENFADFRDALDDAIYNGSSLEEFKQQLAMNGFLARAAGDLND